MELPIQLEKHSREPIYHQIEQQIKTLIASEFLTAEASLPSIRALAKQLEVSVITTRKVYQNLETSGFIYTQQGKGSFIAPINENIKKEMKQLAIYKAFDHAIETALHYGHNSEQIHNVIQDILKAKE